MTRSTASRRARNSASLRIGGRRRPASRPSRRRCRLASRRVDPRDALDLVGVLPLVGRPSRPAAGARGRRCSAGRRPRWPRRRRSRRHHRSCGAGDACGDGWLRRPGCRRRLVIGVVVVRVVVSASPSAWSTASSDASPHRRRLAFCSPRSRDHAHDGHVGDAAFAGRSSWSSSVSSDVSSSSSSSSSLASTSTVTSPAAVPRTARGRTVRRAASRAGTAAGYAAAPGALRGCERLRHPWGQPLRVRRRPDRSPRHQSGLRRNRLAEPRHRRDRTRRVGDLPDRVGVLQPTGRIPAQQCWRILVSGVFGKVFDLGIVGHVLSSSPRARPVRRGHARASAMDPGNFPGLVMVSLRAAPGNPRCLAE